MVNSVAILERFREEQERRRESGNLAKEAPACDDDNDDDAGCSSPARDAHNDRSNDALDAEEWLTSPLGRRLKGSESVPVSQLLRNWNARYDGHSGSWSEARSSLSSPGKSGYKERLRRRVLKNKYIEQKYSEEVAKEEREAGNRSLYPAISEGAVMSWNSGHDSPSKRGSFASDMIQAENRLMKSLFPRPNRIGKRQGLVQRLPRSRNVTVYRANRIRLHIYDLIDSETVVLLPWGCGFPLGRCFGAVNAGLHSLGTGAYHVGVEINGIEYAYGANDIEGSSGVFSCIPRRSPGFQYRSSIDFGERPLVKKVWTHEPSSPGGSPVYREMQTYVDGRDVVREMAKEYLGTDYDLFRKNCCTFALDLCSRLNVQDSEVPLWFRNLSHAGAMTQDVASSAISPIQNMLSACDENDENLLQTVSMGDQGFEVVTRHQDGEMITQYEFVDAIYDDEQRQAPKYPKAGLRQAVSWAY